MKLEKGIIGIWGKKEQPVKSSSDVLQFKTSIYPIEYTGAYKILGFKDDEIIKNYSRLSIIDKSNNNNFDVLINSVYPYFCGVMVDSFNFIDLPIEIRNYADSKFTYLTPEELNSKFEKNDLSELNEAELKAIKYWKPKTFGEIIFNTYD